MKRLALFVEGKGDAAAVSIIVKRLLTEQNAWDCLFPDSRPFVVGEVGRLLKDDCRQWRRWLGAAAKHGDLGAVLLVLDGDIEKLQGKAFCAASLARALATESERAGGGRLFSVAAVFACREFESWLIAGVESLAGKNLEDGRPGIEAGTRAPEGDLESAPRDAKGWLRQMMERGTGYSPARDQA
uniref:DUF4276 family protein n=1 Tax=Candidatus Kentrum eta TaxID=2126337 RepID=A0A450UWE5_9GAMM|nr:MAG: protein of unknown function (DUF4276) [Candidatus Kentron sp. H]VFJ96850.1 MAG: protein of unknown function (DUF4276) [Candidatus Kentron sp. H]VFK02619.1 MAG: protein of unknown function (DUF4276) [Candidatus Kentron sp. H]